MGDVDAHIIQHAARSGEIASTYQSRLSMARRRPWYISSYITAASMHGDGEGGCILACDGLSMMNNECGGECSGHEGMRAKAGRVNRHY